MKTIRLPETHATRLHLECVCEDGNTFCIETKAHCDSVQVPDGVVDIRITPCDADGKPVPDGSVLRIRQSAEYMVVR